MKKEKNKEKADKKELEEYKFKCEETESLLKRVQADFENFKKRIDKEKQLSIEYITADVIRKMLPIIDSFEQAMKNKSDKEEFMQGLDLIYSQINSFLDSFNIRKIKAVDKVYDPQYHEVLMQETSDKGTDGVITEEIQKGYMIGDRILRTSKVKILRVKNGEDKKDNTEGKGTGSSKD